MICERITPSHIWILLFYSAPCVENNRAGFYDWSYYDNEIILYKFILFIWLLNFWKW